MARKKKEDEVQSAPAESEVKPVRLALSPDHHRKLRIIAAEEGKSMSSLAHDIVANFIDGIHKEVKKGAK